MLLRGLLCGDTPHPDFARQGPWQGALGLNFEDSLRSIYYFARFPYDFANAVLTTLLCHTRGFLRMRFSFSVRSRSSVSRVSVPFRRVVGLALSGAVLFLVLARSAFAFVVSRLVGCVVWVRRACLFCLWCGVARFCPCCALIRFVGGLSPFF